MAKIGRKIKVNSPHASRGIEKSNAQNRRAVVQRDQREGAERPEDQRMRHARKRPLANHFCLAQHLPDEIAHAFADGEEMKIRILFRLQNFAEDGPEAPPESVDRRAGQRDEQHLFPRSQSAGVRPELAADSSWVHQATIHDGLRPWISVVQVREGGHSGMHDAVDCTASSGQPRFALHFEGAPSATPAAWLSFIGVRTCPDI